ncbi:MAG: hypothetical protein HC845_06135, partial [Akkermansiaceae bacterium]|nr:hypothetical protein [Akkermansiaceae bacterium]
MKPKHAAKFPFTQCLLASCVTLSLTCTMHAQVGPGNFTNLNVTGNGTILAQGDANSPILPSLSAGNRMLWYPRKGAFRAGGGPDSLWTDAAMGNYSTSFGISNNASNYASTAFGVGNTANGWASTAFGAENAAFSHVSIAFGEFNIASSYASTAFGSFNTASGEISTAFGTNNTASSYASTAFGTNNTASGYYSTAMGFSTIASSYAETVIGSRNQSIPGNPTAWNPNDSLFQIGNGNTTPSNALTVFKNGNMTLQGNLTLGGSITSAGQSV